MSNPGKFVLDFVGNVAKGIAGPVIGTGEDLGTDIYNEAHGTNLTPQQRAQQMAGPLGAVGRAGQDVSQATGTARNLASNIAGTAVLAAGGAIGKTAASGLGAEGAAEGAGLGAKVAAGAAKGAVEGAAVGGSFGAAQGVGSANSPGKFGLDFIQGAGEGAAFGGAVGGAVPALKPVKPMTEAGATTLFTGGGDIAKPSDNFQPEDLQKMAESDDPKAVAKQLEPVTGKVLAQEIAPAIVKTNDPNVAANIIDRSVNNKLTPGGLETPQAPSLPQGPPPPTPTDNINTPQQVEGQASAAIANEPSLLAQTSALPDQTAEERQAELDASANAHMQKVKEFQNRPQPTPEDESLFSTAPQDFMHGPNDEPAAQSKIGDLGVITKMTDILNSGGTVDEALKHYMDNTPGANYQDAYKAVNDLREQSPESLNQSKINQTLNPRYEEGRNLVASPVGAADNDSVMTKTRMAHNAIMREGAKAVVEVRQLDSHDLQLMDAARDKTPEQVANAAHSTANDSAQFLKAWQATTNYDNLAQGIGSGGLEQQVAFRQNHLLTRYTTAGEDTGALSRQASAQERIRPGYGTGRTNEGQPRFDNFLQDLEHDVQVKSNDIGQLTFSKSLGEAYPAQVAQGNLPGGYKQINLPFAKGISLPSDIADELNKRAVNPATGALKGYDTLNSALKSLKLGGGLFHGLSVLGSFGGQQIASGKALTNPGAIGNVMKATFSDKAMTAQMSQLDQQGVLRAADRLGLEYNRFGVSADVGGTGKINNLPFLKQIHQSIFGRQIPMMKLLTLQQKLQDAGIDPKNMSDEDIQYGTKMAKELNQNYGGMNRMIQGLTPNQFRVVSRALLATDYTEGQLKTLGDAFTKGGADGKLAREVVAGKALLWGGIATAAGAAGGEFQGMSPKQVAEDIAMKAINPSFQFGQNTIGLPETQLSEFTKPIVGSIKNASQGANAANPIKDFFSARLAGVPALGEEIASNRTYSGNALRGTDYYGRPISDKQTAANLASTVAPIPLSQTAQTATGGQSLGAAIGNTLGLNVKPTYPASYAPIAGQTYIQELEQTPGVSSTKITQTTKFYDLLEQNARNKTKITTQVQKAIQAGNTQKAQQIVQNYNQKLISTLMPWAKQGGTQYLDSTMLQSLQSAELTPGKASENIPYIRKTNPTSIGAPIPALASSPTNQ